MKRLGILVLFLGGCVNNKNLGDEEVVKVFNEWRAAVINNDFDSLFARTSDQSKSEWLFTVFAAKQKLSFDSYSMLPESLVPDFEHWLKTAYTFAEVNNRPTLLPNAILIHPWLKEVLKRSYNENRDKLRVEFQNMKVVQVAKDEKGATVRIMNFNNQTELYTLVQKDSKWLIDGHVLPPVK